FLINTWGSASNQSIVEYDVPIDTNNDGNADYFVVGVDGGIVLAGQVDGRPLSIIINATTHAVVDAYLAEAPMNGSIIELPTLASEIGITPPSGKGPKGGPQSGFFYAVAAFSQLTDDVDVTASAQFDAFRPSVSSGNGAALPANDGSASVALAADASQFNKL